MATIPSRAAINPGSRRRPATCPSPIHRRRTTPCSRACRAATTRCSRTRKRGKPGDGGDNPGGKNQPAGNVQKVTAADAFASRRQRRRAAQFQSVLERFLQEQARRTASRIAPAYDQRRVAKATTGELMSFVEEAGVELEK